MLHPRRYRLQRTGRDRSDWLGLLHKTLSFSTPSRFIPGAFWASPERLRKLPFPTLKFHSCADSAIDQRGIEMGDERELKAAVSCGRTISPNVYAAISQAAPGVITLSTCADSRLSRLDASNDVHVAKCIRHFGVYDRSSLDVSVRRTTGWQFARQLGKSHSRKFTSRSTPLPSPQTMLEVSRQADSACFFEFHCA